MPTPSPASLFLAGIVESDAFDKALLDSSHFFLASKGVVCQTAVSCGGRTSQAWKLSSFSFKMLTFQERLLKIVASDLRGSTAALH